MTTREYARNGIQWIRRMMLLEDILLAGEPIMMEQLKPGELQALRNQFGERLQETKYRGGIIRLKGSKRQ